MGKQTAVHEVPAENPSDIPVTIRVNILYSLLSDNLGQYINHYQDEPYIQRQRRNYGQADERGSYLSFGIHEIDIDGIFGAGFHAAAAPGAVISGVFVLFDRFGGNGIHAAFIDAIIAFYALVFIYLDAEKAYPVDQPETGADGAYQAPPPALGHERQDDSKNHDYSQHYP